MKTRLLVVFIAFFAMSRAMAQENQSSQYDHDLGFNAVFIFQGIFQSQQSPFSVMYKRYKSDNKALRLGVDLSFTETGNSGKAMGGYADYTSGIVNLIIGVEKQQNIGGKWMWYYGIDGTPQFSFDQSTSYNNNTKSMYNKSSSMGIGAKPFVGIRFNVTPRLYVSAEASALLSYNITKTLSKQYNPELITRDLTANQVSFHINPASGIFLFYRF